MATKKEEKVPVSERALMARINRSLTHVGELVRRCTATSRSWPDLGDYYRIDTRTNSLIGTHLDLEVLGSELGALRPYEALAGEP